jgi:hypothetical protein
LERCTFSSSGTQGFKSLFSSAGGHFRFSLVAFVQNPAGHEFVRELATQACIFSPKSPTA